eukprot:7659460-Pyramimonas_sp.AAC.1
MDERRMRCGSAYPVRRRPKRRTSTAAPPSATHPEGVRGGQRGSEGIYQSSLDALEPQNPTRSDEYRRHLQGELYST